MFDKYVFILLTFIGLDPPEPGEVERRQDLRGDGQLVVPMRAEVNDR